MDVVHPQVLLDVAGPVLKALAGEVGFTRLAVFGSVARGTASPDSDIDLIEQVLGREVDLIDYGGTKPNIDDDTRREAVLL